MDADLIKGILTVIAASIPLLIALVALFRSQIYHNKIIDSSSLKIYCIKREPSERKMSLKNKEVYLHYLWIDLAVLIYYIAIYLLAISIKNIYHHPMNSSQIFLLVLIPTLILIFINSIIIVSNFIKVGYDLLRNYYYFKQAILIIEADRYYLFNKCHETLRAMNFKVLEVDKNAGTILALKIPFYLIRARQIKICIEQHCGIQGIYNVKLEFVTIVGELESSKITNHFVNHLISKSKNGDDKAESKIDVSTDVGD